MGSIQDHVREALAKAQGLDDEIREYVAEMASGVLEEADPKQAKDKTRQELFEAIGEVLEGAGLGSAEIDALCDGITAAFIGECPSERNGSGAGASGPDLIVNLRGIILAYAGRVLMRACDLQLERGRRYGLLGQNGVGKTTLLTRVAAGDIVGFPKDVHCVYVQHEVLANASESVITFMSRGLSTDTDTDTPADTAAVSAALSAVGFSEALQNAAVSELSGGWRMRMAIARSMLKKVDILVLDEPTNHLDVGAVAWLREYLTEKLPGVTMLMVSHDIEFLEAVCDRAIHFHDLRLDAYPGGVKEFREKNPDVLLPGRDASCVSLPAAASAASLAPTEETLRLEMGMAPSADSGLSGNRPFLLPDPGPLDGVKTRNKVILRADDIAFTYPGAPKPSLKHVSVRLCLASRVAIVGANGAGKTTLLKMLVGETEQTPGIGELWRHHNLRVSYVAQHSMHHLEEQQNLTPLEYIQSRFFSGRDREDMLKSTIALTPEEEAERAKRGSVEAIVGRRQTGKELFYEVRKTGRKEKDNTWEPLTYLRQGPPYVMKMVKDYDEKLKALQSGMEVRPLTALEVKTHLNDFGLGEELALSKIKGFSGGQRSRLVLAAALWSKPHLLALDEPTNYLDREAVANLSAALKTFQGAVLVVSHSEGFVEALCNERWKVENGTVARRNPRATTPEPSRFPPRVILKERKMEN